MYITFDLHMIVKDLQYKAIFFCLEMKKALLQQNQNVQCVNAMHRYATHRNTVMKIKLQ